jgi:hypothetical protein
MKIEAHYCIIVIFGNELINYLPTGENRDKGLDE